jgi:hypothetical protein
MYSSFRYESSNLAKRFGAFPSRQLYLLNRPGHLIFLDQLLQLSRALVDGSTLFRQQVRAKQLEQQLDLLGPNAAAVTCPPDVKLRKKHTLEGQGER